MTDTHITRMADHAKDCPARSGSVCRCAASPPPQEPKLWDLPIFGWAWREDGRDLRA